MKQKPREEKIPALDLYNWIGKSKPKMQRDIKSQSRSRSQIPPQGLLPLKSLKQTLKISSPKSIKSMSLDHLHKDRWPIPNMLGEDLQ